MNKEKTLRVKLKHLPELVVSERDGIGEGVSAAFGGVLEDGIVIAGGCNFPGKPAADGGGKVYYDRIYVLRHPERRSAQWEQVGTLPVKAANGASVTLPEGVVCIGGRNQQDALNKVWLLKWNVDRSAIVVSNLPDLPVTMDNMGAATDGKKIYVGGGNCNELPQNRCFVLNHIEADEWQELPVFPGPVRLQPVAIVAGKRFHLIGGFQPVIDGQECVVPANGVRYCPERQEWSEMEEIIPGGETDPRAFVGANGLVWSEQKWIFQGGVDRSIFKSAVDNPVLQKRAVASGQTAAAERLQREQAAYMKHEPGWYRFNRQLLIYDTTRACWTSVGDFGELARAGAVLVVYKNKLIVVNGETKPGIRSAGVYRIDLED